jgi:DNA invertase Pin-like site-specific DNA recombinase
MAVEAKKLKCVIYARVSTKDKNQTNENQILPLRELANRHGWEIYDYYQDEISAAKNRPEFLRLMRDVKKKQFDIILVSRIDRLARSLKNLINVVEEIVTENGIRLWFVDQNIDVNPKHPMSMLLVHFLGAVAEFERSLISERVKSGIDRWKKQNPDGTFGKPKKIIDKELLRQYRADGMTIKQIAEKLGVHKNTVITRLREIGLIVHVKQKSIELAKENKEQEQVAV